MENRAQAKNWTIYMRRGAMVFSAVGSLSLASIGHATDDKEEQLTKPPAIYTDLIACKDLADSQQRLSCYDG